MRIVMVSLLLAVTFAAMGGCSPGEDGEGRLSSDGAPAADPGSPTDVPVVPSDQAGGESAAALQVSRTRKGNGGIIAVAGYMTMEFDYSPPQGRCQASEGKFVARGISINDEQAGVSINYEPIVAPDTGRVVGPAFLLEIRKDGYVPWVVHVGTGLAGSIEDISQDTSPDGGVTLSVTGTASGFRENRAPTGVKAPFRLEATCEPQSDR